MNPMIGYELCFHYELFFGFPMSYQLPLFLFL
jgi:hypothetical protein